MANRIKGITIEIDGNATPLQKALSGVNKDLKTTQSNLKDVQKLLKLDGGNIDLIKQKQKYLSEAIKDTEEKLKKEKDALAQLKNADQTPEVQRQMEALQRQISEDEQSLKSLKKEFSSFGSVAKQELEAIGNKLKDVGGHIKDFGGKIKGVGDSVKGFGQSLTTHLTVPLAAIGAKGVASFAEVDKTMTLTRKTMGATAEEAEILDKAMKEAAANSTFGMSDAADASLNFARAGLTATEAADALAPAMNLAAGEGGNLDTVSAGLVATINGFGDEFDKTTHYADVFANACNNSALDVNSLSESMSIAAPIFSAAGYEVEDAALYMGILADNGIDANKGATALKTGMARLVSPAKQGAEMMKKLGISVTNADGSMKDSVTIQRELHDAFGQLSESEQIAAASAIFGKNQMAPWLALINAAPADVEELSQALGVEGTTAEMAETMMSGFGGSIEKLKSSIDVAVTSLGEALAPVISIVADKIQALVDWFNSLDSEQQQMIATIGLVIAAIGPVVMAVGGVIGAIGSVISGIGSIISIGGALISGLGLLLSPVGLVVAAIAALIAVGVLLYQNWDTVCQWAAKLKENVVQAWKDLKESVSQTVQILKDAIVNTWEAIKTGVSSIISAIKTAVTDTWRNIRDTVVSFVTSIHDGVVRIWEGIKSAITNAIDTIKNTVCSTWENIKTTVIGIIDQMRDGIAYAWDMIKAAVSKAIEAIKSAAVNSWEAIKSAIGRIIDTIKTTITNAWEAIKTAVSRVIDGIKTAVSTGWENIKSTVSNVGTAIKTVVTNAWEGIKTAISNVLSSVASVVGQKWDSIKYTISTAISNIKSTISGGFSGLSNIVSNAFSGVYNAIQTKMMSAYNYLQNALSNIKSLFNFSWSLPHISLPHFSWYWQDIGGFFSIPMISVSWYKKAYETPYLFTDPTVVGGRGFGDGGGSGEIVYGRDQLMRDIALASQGETTNVINVYASDGMDINQLANQIQSRLVQLQRQKEAVYA